MKRLESRKTRLIPTPRATRGFDRPDRCLRPDALRSLAPEAALPGALGASLEPLREKYIPPEERSRPSAAEPARRHSAATAKPRQDPARSVAWSIPAMADIFPESRPAQEISCQSGRDESRLQAAASAACACQWQKASCAWPDLVLD